MALQEPLAVVAFDELADLVSGLLKAVEVVEVQTLLLERADEPLHDTVALWLPHIGRGRPDPESPEFALKLVGRVLRAPVMS